ncbi:hypothetical protein GQ457_05G024020 [Hibiscus cannabinus]
MARCKNAPETSGCTTPTLQIRYFEDDDAKTRHQTIKGRQTLAEKGYVFKGTSTEGFPPNVMATIAMHKWEKFVAHPGAVEPNQKAINVNLVQEFYAHLTSPTHSSIKKGVFESLEDLQKKGRLGITTENIPSLMGFDETAPAKQPLGGARTVAAAKLAALTTMAENTRDQLERLRTDLRTYFNYVQERDQFPYVPTRPVETKMPKQQPAQPAAEHTTDQPQDKPLGTDSASSSPTPPDATPQHQSPPTQRRKGKEPATTPVALAVEVDSEETAALEEEEPQRTPTPPVATTPVRRRTKRTTQRILVDDNDEEVQSGAGEEDQPTIIPPTHPTSIKHKATKRAKRATTK